MTIYAQGTERIFDPIDNDNWYWVPEEAIPLDGDIVLWETEKAPLAESLPGANATTRSEQGGYTRLYDEQTIR